MHCQFTTGINRVISAKTSITIKFANLKPIDSISIITGGNQYR